nr:hypothetical protein [Pseudomonas aeruginosa]
MTATSDLIESLISYSWDDWQVTRQEARRVIAAIRNVREGEKYRGGGARKIEI